MKKIKLFFELLWLARLNILQIFLILFIISLCGKTPYSLLTIFSIDISLSIIITSIIIIKYWIKYDKQKINSPK